MSYCYYSDSYKTDIPVIPKIIHQIWSGIKDPLPDRFKRYGDTWKKYHPDWQYELWDEVRMNEFVQTYYPNYWERYRNLPYDIQRWDTIRYLLLYQMGGLYADFDYECLKPMDELILGKSCGFALEPSSCNKVVFNNALMFAVPMHPFMKRIIAHIFSDSCLAIPQHPKGDCVMSTTGPWMLHTLYQQLLQEEKAAVWLIPSQYVTPLDWGQAQIAVKQQQPHHLALMKDAYAVHYFCSTWWDNKDV